MDKQAEKTGIDFYTWNTPNGRKVSIMLEEVSLPYRVIPIDITKDDQFSEDFLAISPNNKIPALVDHDTGVTLMESGAILMYLANKTGKFMSATNSDEYWDEMQWLMFQMGGVGPMLGQTHHFVKFNPGKSSYAEERYSAETARLYGVLDRRLSGRDYICNNYSIVDMATWPWYGRTVTGESYDAGEFLDVGIYENVARWERQIAVRPAVQRGKMVNKTNGHLEGQLHERHDARDFETRTQDKLEG